MSRINNKKLIEELEKIRNSGDCKFVPNFNVNEPTTFKQVFQIDSDLLYKAITKLKELENIYNQ